MNTPKPGFSRWIFTLCLNGVDRLLIPFQWLWFNIRDLYLSVRPARMPIIVNIFVFILFFWVPQGGDLLRTLSEGAVRGGWALDGWRPLAFAIAISLLCMSSYYWTQVMLHFEHLQSRRIVPKDEREIRFRLRDSTIQRFRAILPHFLGAMPLLMLALSVGKAAMEYGSGAPSVPWWGRVWLFALGWVAWMGIGIASLRFRKEEPRKMDQILDLWSTPSGKGATLVMAAPPLLLLAFLIWPVGLGWTLGSGAILCLAAGGWVSLGSLLVYFGSTYRVPVFGALFTLAIISSCLMDNHGVRQVAKAVAPPIAATPSQESDEGPLAAAFGKWLDKRLTGEESDVKPRPVFIVATEGGGIRAAYWTATVLGRIQEQTLDEQIKAPGQPDFASHLFAISGVSGGSVGAAVFSSLLADGYWGANLTNAAQGVLGMDHLAPDLGTMFFGDFIQRMLPWDVARPIHWATGTDWPVIDRGTALEKSWEQAYAWWALKDNGRDPTQRNRMSEGFSRLWLDALVEPPSLFLNATLVESGSRFVASNIPITYREFTDVTDAMTCFGPSPDYFSRDPAGPMEVRLSTAAHLSARFTYFSPAGRLVDGRRVVDGGYFENSGTTTASELIRGIRQVLQARDEKAEKNLPPGGTLAAKDRMVNKVIPVLIKITNDPERSKGQTERPMFMSEVKSPIEALLNTRTARGSYSEMSARNLQQILAGPGLKYLDFGLAEDVVPLPLGWSLSREAAREMRDQMDGNFLAARDKSAGKSRKTEQTRNNLDMSSKIIGWLSGPPARAVEKK